VKNVFAAIQQGGQQNAPRHSEMPEMRRSIYDRRAAYRQTPQRDDRPRQVHLRAPIQAVDRFERHKMEIQTLTGSDFGRTCLAGKF
jgi:hypothetical protein